MKTIWYKVVFIILLGLNAALLYQNHRIKAGSTNSRIGIGTRTFLGGFGKCYQLDT
jgi:hypothetical protein